MITDILLQTIKKQKYDKEYEHNNANIDKKQNYRKI